MHLHIYNNPDKYSQNNSLQYDFAASILDNLEIDKVSRVLDIGCGDGKITNRIAESAFEGTVIGTDISYEMVDHAARTYNSLGNITFAQMDASKNIFIAQFDLITSFNCLHWVKDQQKALDGIARAAVENAKVVLLLGHRKSLYHEALESVCAKPAWRPYFQDYINPRSFFDVDSYKEMLKKAGLAVNSIKEEELTHSFDSREGLKGFFSSSMANVKQIPDTEKDKFLSDFCDEFIEHLGTSNSSNIPVCFWSLVVIATKPKLEKVSSLSSSNTTKFCP